LITLETILVSNPVPERDLVKLVENPLVEAFADAVGLRMIRLGFGVLDVIQGHVKLVIMLRQSAAIFGAVVSQHTKQHHAKFFQERQQSSASWSYRTWLWPTLNTCRQRFAGLSTNS
jgi:hypothetical protein